MNHRYENDKIHACEKGYAGVHGRSPLLVWTLCGKDVPANQSYMTDDEDVTCKHCELLLIEPNSINGD